MKQFRVNVLANVASDANDKSYPEYLIPEPVSFDRYQADLAKLEAAPPGSIGRDPKLVPPEMYGVIRLKRGTPPVELVMSEALLKTLRCDKKNLAVFGEVEVVEAEKAKARQ